MHSYSSYICILNKIIVVNHKHIQPASRIQKQCCEQPLCTCNLSLAAFHPQAGTLIKSSCVEGGADGVLETGEGLPLTQGFLTLQEGAVKASNASYHTIIYNQICF